MSIELIIEIIGALLALLYLWLEIRQRSAMWVVGIISSLFYIYIFFQAKFYADVALQGYYIIAGIYGLVLWQRGKFRTHDTPSGKAKLAVSHTPLKTTVVLAVIALLLFGLFAGALQKYTDSPVPYGDALTTALSVVATWMLAHKFIEQWWIWLVVNAVSVGLYVWRGLYPTALLFFCYAVASLLGYYSWRKEIVKKTL
ncbi:MAG: nicotinamide riboside transporter PnuC [Prevotellaceae bacterium]|nr:nicotinamide riboside transporter PnuC [Prevotellaceae bacterium]